MLPASTDRGEKAVAPDIRICAQALSFVLGGTTVSPGGARSHGMRFAPRTGRVVGHGVYFRSLKRGGTE